MTSLIEQTNEVLLEKSSLLYAQSSSILRRVMLMTLGCTLLTNVVFNSKAGAATESVVGMLPFSNHYETEKQDSFLFFVFEPESLGIRNFSKNQFSAATESSQAYFYGLDFSTRLMNFQKSFSSVSLGWRAGLQFSSQSTHVSSATEAVPSASSSGQLFIGKFGTGPSLDFAGPRWAQPYASLELIGYVYRNTSTLSSLDISGNSWAVAPSIGLRSQVFDPFSLIAQASYQRNLGAPESGLIDSSFSWMVGAGLVF